MLTCSNYSRRTGFYLFLIFCNFVHLHPHFPFILHNSEFKAHIDRFADDIFWFNSQMWLFPHSDLVYLNTMWERCVTFTDIDYRPRSFDMSSPESTDVGPRTPLCTRAEQPEIFLNENRSLNCLYCKRGRGKNYQLGLVFILALERNFFGHKIVSL